jgi:predicted secreted protein
MTDKIGRIKDSLADKRGGKIVFVSHCILNQNACVRGLASQPAVIREVVNVALDNDVAFYQMPCPEVTYMGSMRWGMVVKMYGTPMFKRHCRRIAELICDQIETYRANGHEIKGIVMRDGSPTCGLRCSAVEADADQVWGGMVWHANPLQRFGAVQGVYTEQLLAEIAARGLDVRMMTMPEVPEAGDQLAAVAEMAEVFAGPATP